MIGTALRSAGLGLDDSHSPSSCLSQNHRATLKASYLAKACECFYMFPHCTRVTNRKSIRESGQVANAKGLRYHDSPSSDTTVNTFSVSQITPRKCSHPFRHASIATYLGEAGNCARIVTPSRLPRISHHQRGRSLLR